MRLMPQSSVMSAMVILPRGFTSRRRLSDSSSARLVSLLDMGPPDGRFSPYTLGRRVDVRVTLTSGSTTGSVLTATRSRRNLVGRFRAENLREPRHGERLGDVEDPAGHPEHAAPRQPLRHDDRQSERRRDCRPSRWAKFGCGRLEKRVMAIAAHEPLKNPGLWQTALGECLIKPSCGKKNPHVGLTIRGNSTARGPSRLAKSGTTPDS